MEQNTDFDFRKVEVNASKLSRIKCNTHVLNILLCNQQRNSWKRYLVRAVLFFSCLSENMEYDGSVNGEKRYPHTVRRRNFTLHKNFILLWSGGSNSNKILSTIFKRIGAALNVVNYVMKNPFIKPKRPNVRLRNKRMLRSEIITWVRLHTTKLYL